MGRKPQRAHPLFSNKYVNKTTKFVNNSHKEDSPLNSSHNDSPFSNIINHSSNHAGNRNSNSCNHRSLFSSSSSILHTHTGNGGPNKTHMSKGNNPFNHHPSNVRPSSTILMTL